MEIEQAMRRLAFIKYMHKVGIEQAGKSEPFCWTSVLTFHDAVELFLELSLEHLHSDKRPKDVKFMQYWDELNALLKEKGKRELTQRASMDKLNGARVAFKHHGTPPSKTAIEDFRSSVSNFFEENVQTVFGFDFADIALLELVRYDLTKNCLKKAEGLLKQGKIDDALDEVAIAFTQLIDDYEKRKRDEFGRSPFFFGKRMEFLDSFFMGLRGKLGDFVDRTKESIEAIQDVVKILSMSIDYRRYARFRLLTPYIERYVGGKLEAVRMNRGSRGTPTVEDVDFCINFVIESALALQEFDFEVTKAQEE